MSPDAVPSSLTRCGIISGTSSSSEHRAVAQHITHSWDFEPESHSYYVNSSSQPDKQLEKSRTLEITLSRRETEQRISDESAFSQTECFSEEKAAQASPAAGSLRIRSTYEKLHFQKPELDAEDPNFGKISLDLEDWENIYDTKPSPRELRERKHISYDRKYEINSEDTDEIV
ncbi:hypothetical protein WAI453_013457 [Rhynchosporium graminicola]